jgi:hypothetical protein
MDGSKWKDVNYHTWFKSMTGGPTSQEDLQPPHFTVAASSTSIPWILPEVPFLVRGNPSPPKRPLAGEGSPDLALGLRLSSPHSPLPESSSLASRHRHFPTLENSSGDMAFQFVDPTPFITRGYNRVMIPGRRPMSRVILGRPSRRNLDLAIATVHSPPSIRYISMPSVMCWPTSWEFKLGLVFDQSNRVRLVRPTFALTPTMIETS